MQIWQNFVINMEIYLHLDSRYCEFATEVTVVEERALSGGGMIQEEPNGIAGMDAAGEDYDI